MKKKLAELWWEAAGPTVQYEGMTIHAAVFKRVTRPGRFIVRFLRAVPNPIQALRMDIDPGKLIIEGEGSPKMVLRLDTCPEVVGVDYLPARGGSRITIYNAWIDENDQIDAWVMNYGMLVEEEGDKMILRCNHGRSEPTFDDLIVEIEFLDD